MSVLPEEGDYRITALRDFDNASLALYTAGGMTVVTLILAWKTGCRKFFWILFPFALILFFATVYVKAHYVVDSVAGILFGCLFYLLANFIFRAFQRKKEGITKPV